VEIKSLGYRTDLFLLGLGGSEIQDTGPYVVIRTPANPMFWWGNYLLHRTALQPGELTQRLAEFRTEFPAARHVALGIDTVDGVLGIGGRPGLPREKLLLFSIRRTREICSNYPPALWFRLKLELLRRRIMNDPASASYTDVALSPVDDDLDTHKLELFQATEAARHAAEQARLKATANRNVEQRGTV